MRIWIVNHYAIPPSEPGGTRHFNLARELVSRGHEVVIVASSFRHGTHKHGIDPNGHKWAAEVVEGVRFLWLRTPAYAGNSLGRMRNMLTFAWRVLRTPIGGPPDIVIGSSPHPFAALAALRLSRRYRVPFFLEIRDLWPQTLIELGRVPSLHPLVIVLGAIERYLYARADRIITLLPGAGAHMTDKGADPDKICWIPNGVDLNAIPRYSPPNDRSILTVMYAGSHGLANGLDSLLDAAKMLKQNGWSNRIVFRLIGDGPEKRRLQQRSLNEGIDIVRFEEPVPKDQVFTVMQQADVFIATLRDSPLYKWGMSLNKLYDYMGVGRPIVFGANTPWNPILEADAGIVVPPEDSTAMAEAVQRLALEPLDNRLLQGQRGRQFVEAHHSFGVLADRLEGLMDTVVRR